MEQQRLAYLLQRLADNSITGEEHNEMMTHLHAHPGDDLSAEAGEAFLAANEHIPTDFTPYEHIARDIAGLDRMPARRTGWLAMLNPRKVAAAAIILIAGYGIYTLLRKPADKPQLVQRVDILPGREGAILTRGDGSTVVLDSVTSGEMTEHNGARLKVQQGHVSYANATASNTENIYNTITTPNAGTFHLLLQDGTEIWLNAGSSVTYPVVFTGNERKVKITGEAYFEVAKAAGKPFLVNVNDRAEVEVLGTHFNVNAYADEAAIKTALLEGAIRVRSKEARTAVLKPGQQAVIDKAEMKVEPADAEEVSARRNGLFHFRKATVPEMMREVARWYDVEVRFEGAVPERTFSGDIERTLSLQQVLTILRVTRINYTIDNQKQITIRN
ncbi:FecR domain-containing protein [Chitinophaga sedimenti]|uniref:FecR family protein n=1 Tax=Chitinophaga sedimenti TaxID=2033606 RepID=UPI002005808B|nr:FecR domain-containing protein [Chitinophaga sedimenti]MCK7554687.1 FecR domain-containing protein [Chitinophaga sedimenti]